MCPAVRTTPLSSVWTTDVRRADTAALHRFGVEGPSADGDASAQLTHFVEVGARVDEAAERHVAGDPAEAVEPGDGRHVRLVT